MKLNKTEFALMNNPIRAFIQEKHEIRVLRRMTPITNIGIALEIGCGNGYGTKLIKAYFCPSRIVAIDLDEKQFQPAGTGNFNGYGFEEANQGIAPKILLGLGRFPIQLVRVVAEAIPKSDR